MLQYVELSEAWLFKLQNNRGMTKLGKSARTEGAGACVSGWHSQSQDVSFSCIGHET